MSQPMDNNNNNNNNELPPKDHVKVDNFSKVYGPVERMRHKREDVDPEIAREIFKGNMKNMKYVTSESTVTEFDAVDDTGKTTKISAVDLKYTLGNNTVLIKANGKMYTGSEAQMRYNMLPDMKITGKGYDRKYETPKSIPTSKFSFTKL